MLEEVARIRSFVCPERYCHLQLGRGKARDWLQQDVKAHALARNVLKGAVACHNGMATGAEAGGAGG